MTHIGVEVVLIGTAVLRGRGSSHLFSLPCVPLALLLAALEFTVWDAIMFNPSMIMIYARLGD